MMEFVGLLSILGIVVFIVLLIISLVKKKSKMISIIGLSACFVVFILALVLSPPSEPRNNNRDASDTSSPTIQDNQEDNSNEASPENTTLEASVPTTNDTIIDERGNEIINTRPTSFVSAKGNQLFLSLFTQGGSSDGIARITIMDESTLTRISDQPANDINTDGEWIYYISIQDGKIYRMRNDGSENHLLIDERCGQLVLYNDRIYFTSWERSQALCSATKDGSDIKQLSDISTLSFTIQNNRIIFAGTFANAGIFSIDTDGSNLATLTDDATLNFVAYEEHLFYANILDNNSLYRIDLNTLERTRIVDSPASSLNISGSHLFFRNTESNMIYRTDFIGNSHTSLFAIDRDVFYVYDDLIIYLDSVSHGFNVRNADGTGQGMLILHR